MLKKIKDIMAKKKDATSKEQTKDAKDEVLTEVNPNEVKVNLKDQDDVNAEDANNEEEQANLTPEEQLQAQINELEIEKAELKDKHLRLFAEFDNFKKRSSKQILDIQKTASSKVIQSMLPVLDDFDRAKQNAEADNNIEQWSEGVVLVFNKLHKIMEQQGVKAMESTGLEFDPDLHEAITEIPAPTDDMKGKIIDTVEKGYTLNDKIIRHAKVVVGK